MATGWAGIGGREESSAVRGRVEVFGLTSPSEPLADARSLNGATENGFVLRVYSAAVGATDPFHT